jgi:hypothetical protein
MDTVGYLVLRNVLNTEVIELLKTQTKLFERVECFKKKKFQNEYPFGDSDCPRSFAKYGFFMYDALLLILKPIIERHVGKELLPTCSYMRVYYKNSELVKHRDRPACEYSATICISIDKEPWDIFFAGEKEVGISLCPGDLIIYKGIEIEHWREPYDGTEQIQIFLHYVDKNGCYADLVNDKRPILGIEK